MSEGAQILVVEDSETQALALRRVLEAEGFTVQTATSAERALEMLNEQVPDLLVADFHLPGMDGRELSRQIRLNGRTRALPLLMLTSARELDLERQGLESGADAYVPKAAGMDVVVARLRTLLRPALVAPRPERGDAFRPGVLLVVHDSATQRLRLSHLLAHEGYETLSASTLDEAVALATDAVDCVVAPFSGLGLPELELCRRLDALRMTRAAGFQIVVIGPGADRPNDLAATFGAGADGVVASDDDDDVLKVRIRALMRRKLLADENRRVDEAEARAAVADELAAANGRLREAQAQLVQSAKMASLGELVAGIAHEINNPLAFILGHQDTIERLSANALEALPPDSPPAVDLTKARDRLASMRIGLQRIQELVLNLRKFSRLDHAEKQDLDVADAAETVLALLKPKLGAIEIQRDMTAKGLLHGSPALLNQVVMNIVANAADALDGAGVIRIATANDGETYRIDIDDSGPGVPADVRERIFEPFFTTKPVGSGTGLGLAIAYNVVKAHGGEILVGDSPLGGARFSLMLPVGRSL
ncbi:response regulator [Phenylobacterium immobile]|uniref:response regulator n=1 Tax=Phenylobacterium immobile TaxID=21 RepID=UPI000AD22810|nr:response regulator [Phenylobacterium immobile]